MSRIKAAYEEEKRKPREDEDRVVVKSIIRLNAYNIPDEQEVKLYGDMDHS